MQITKLYQTKIGCSSYNVAVDSTDTNVTVSLIDFNGNPVVNTEVTINVDNGYFTKYTRNSTNVTIGGTTTKSYNGTTGSDGSFTLTYTAPSESAVVTFSANNITTHMNVFVEDNNAWEIVTLTNPSSTFTLFVNEDLRLCELRMAYLTNAIIESGNHNTSTSVPEIYRPSGVVVGSLQVGGSLYVSNAGAIKWRPINNVGKGQYIYGSVVWNY